jgi:hypothetical protein
MFEPGRSLAGVAAATVLVAALADDGQAAKDAVLLPPAVGAAQLISDIQKGRYRASLPRELAGPGRVYWGLYKICVGTNGAVSKVNVIRSSALVEDGQPGPAARTLDGRWTTAIRSWRYRPYVVAGVAVPFCYMTRLQLGQAIRDPNDPPMLSPEVGTRQLRTDVTRAPHKPSLSPELDRPGITVWGLFKICVTATGDVSSVEIIKSAHESVDARWVETIKTWRYHPYVANGKSHAYCYTLRLAAAGH